jgi:hypothetical protein
MTEATGGRRYYNCQWAQEDVETLHNLLNDNKDLLIMLIHRINFAIFFGSCPYYYTTVNTNYCHGTSFALYSNNMIFRHRL